MKTLTKEIGAIGVTLVGGNGSITEQDGGWKQIAGANQFYNETYFDLAGLSMDEKTLFFTGAATQNANPPTSNPAVPGNRVNLLDIMVTRPLTETELSLLQFEQTCQAQY